MYGFRRPSFVEGGNIITHYFLYIQCFTFLSKLSHIFDMLLFLYVTLLKKMGLTLKDKGCLKRVSIDTLIDSSDDVRKETLLKIKAI